MYTLKTIPEDFIVKEISNVPQKSSGKYLYAKLTKRNLNTIDALKILSKALNIKEKQIGFAGSKDKKAITEQVISFLGVSKERLSSLHIKNLQLQFLGYGDQPISLGDLIGNEFIIIVRNLDAFSITKTPLIPNYFDEQRFGKHNVEIGRCLVKKQFKDAVTLIDEPSCEDHLTKNPTDFVGALRTIPMRLLRLYLNAYQSYLWNETLALYLKKNGEIIKEEPYSQGKFIFINDAEKFKDLQIPILGFGSEELEKDEIRIILEELMRKEALTHQDFIIKQIPQLTLEGELRKAFIKVKDLKTEKEQKDELNPGKKKVTISFTLPKGSYATMAIRRIVSE